MLTRFARARARKHDRWQLGSRARVREPIFDVCFRVCSLVRFFVFFVAVVVSSWSLLLLLLLSLWLLLLLLLLLWCYCGTRSCSVFYCFYIDVCDCC